MVGRQLLFYTESTNTKEKRLQRRKDIDLIDKSENRKNQKIIDAIKFEPENIQRIDFVLIEHVFSKYN